MRDFESIINKVPQPPPTPPPIFAKRQAERNNNNKSARTPVWNLDLLRFAIYSRPRPPIPS